MLAITIKASDSAARDSLRRTDARMLPALSSGLTRGLQFAVGIAQREYLHGPRPARLGTVTTALQSHMATEVKPLGADAIVGRIGNVMPYAAFHEFGFHGIEHVRAHTRVVGGTKSIARKQKAGFVPVGYVRAHDRRIDYKGRPFIRPALDAARPSLEREMKAELQRLADSNA